MVFIGGNLSRWVRDYIYLKINLFNYQTQHRFMNKYMNITDVFNSSSFLFVSFMLAWLKLKSNDKVISTHTFQHKMNHWADFSPENCLFLCQAGQNPQFHSLRLQTLKKKSIKTQTSHSVFNFHKVDLSCVMLTVSASWNKSDGQRRNWISKLVFLFLWVVIEIMESVSVSESSAKKHRYSPSSLCFRDSSCRPLWATTSSGTLSKSLVCRDYTDHIKLVRQI